VPCEVVELDFPDDRIVIARKLHDLVDIEFHRDLVDISARVSTLYWYNHLKDL
jgi:hypothetical protein